MPHRLAYVTVSLVSLIVIAPGILSLRVVQFNNREYPNVVRPSVRFPQLPPTFEYIRRRFGGAVAQPTSDYLLSVKRTPAGSESILDSPVSQPDHSPVPAAQSPSQTPPFRPRVDFTQLRLASSCGLNVSNILARLERSRTPGLPNAISINWEVSNVPVCFSVFAQRVGVVVTTRGGSTKQKFIAVPGNLRSFTLQLSDILTANDPPVRFNVFVDSAAAGEIRGAGSSEVRP